MLARFSGQDRRSFVVDALKSQPIIGQDHTVAELLYDRADVLAFSSGSTIIEESAPDNDIYFILAGIVSIRIVGRELATRTASEHIGEMAVLDPGKPRSASAVAHCDVVAARVSATDFTDVATQNPQLWRNVARELAERLRQRNRFIEPVNSCPILFVGCSRESLHIARAIQSELSYDAIVVKLWTNNVFQASSFPIESLEREVAKADFAALVLSPDDVVVSRDTVSDAPRDNLIFELGLFMGALGRARTFLVYPRNRPIKVPTDLAGITPLSYDSSPHCDVGAAIGPACHELRNSILALGPR